MRTKSSGSRMSDRDNSGQHATTRVVVATIALLALGALRLVAQTNEHSAQVESSGPVLVIIPVEGMSCSACVARVKKALKAVKGVKEVHVILEKREAEVRYDPKKTSPEKFTKAVGDLGYKAARPKKKESPP